MVLLNFFSQSVRGWLGVFLTNVVASGCAVGTVGDPAGIRLGEEVAPAAFLDHSGVMAGSRERAGHCHEVTPVGYRDLDASTSDLPFPGVVRSCPPAGWAAPGRDLGAIDQQEVLLVDGLGEASAGEHQHGLQDLGDPPQDPTDCGLGPRTCLRSSSGTCPDAGVSGRSRPACAA